MAAEARVLNDLTADMLARPAQMGPAQVGPAKAGPARVGVRPRLRSVPPTAPLTLTISSEPKLALREIARIPARLLSLMPVPFTARLRAVDGSVFHLSTSDAEREALTEVGAIVLDGHEWDALVVATEADRAWPADLVRALRARGTTGRLSVEGLLDGVAWSRVEEADAPRMSVALMLGRIGARLEDAWVEREGLAVFP